MPNLYNLNNPTYPYVFKYFQQNKQKRFRPTKKAKKEKIPLTFLPQPVKKNSRF